MAPRLALVVIAFLVLLAGCSSALAPASSQPPAASSTSSTTSASETPPAVVDISIKGFAFSPKAVTVRVGDVVSWTNDEDSASHTATGDSPDGHPQFDSGPLAPGHHYDFQILNAGTFTYHCQFHSGMTATLTVQ